METVQGWFSGLTCCNSLVAKEAATIEEAPQAFTVTCFDESDTELRDVRVHPTHQWKDMQVTITEIYGSPAMFAYDDGTGIDYPVRNQKEWEKFLDILMTEKACNAEYDILLLPVNGWERYNQQQQQGGHAKPAAPPGNGAPAGREGAQTALESGDESAYAVLSSLAHAKLIDSGEEASLKKLVAESSPAVLAALQDHATDKQGVAEALKACLD
jgi:hypothetical protein